MLSRYSKECSPIYQTGRRARPKLKELWEEQKRRLSFRPEVPVMKEEGHRLVSDKTLQGAVDKSHAH